MTERQQVTRRQQVIEVSQTTEGQQVTGDIPLDEGSGSGDVDIEEYSNISLHLAAQQGNLNAVKYFVERGADINAKDEYDETPLHLASKWGRLDIVKYLTEKGADINIKGGYVRGTPLHVAAENGQLEVVKYLIEQGAHVNVTNKNMATPLYCAASYEKSDVVKYLLENRADSNAKDSYGDTPLHEAARVGNFRIVKYLVEHRVKRYGYADLNTKNNRGNTPLHLAVYSNSRIVEYLVEKSAYTSIPNNNGNTPLHLVAKSDSSGAQTIGAFLVNQGANLEAKNNDGHTPVELAEIYHKGRSRRDISNNSWTDNSIINWVKSFLPSSTESPNLLTSREHDNTTVTAIPEINTTVVNNTIMLGILAAGLFNKTKHKQPIHENLLSPREQSMRRIDMDMIMRAIQQGEEESFEGPNTYMDEAKVSGNKTRNVERNK